MVLVVLAALALVATPTASPKGSTKGSRGWVQTPGVLIRRSRERRCFPARFWRASRLSHGMVVSDRQSSRRSRRRLRRSMDAVPPGWRAGRRAPGLGQPDGLDGPCGGDHRHGASVRRDLRPRRRRTGRGNRAAVSRVDQQLIFEARQAAPGASLEAPGSALARAKISANGPGFRYAFDLAADKPLVLHGDSGFSRKSDGGRASYYSASPSRSMGSSCFMEGRLSCRVLRGWIGNGAANPSPDPKGLGLVFVASLVRGEADGLSAERRNLPDFWRGPGSAPTARSRRSIAMTFAGAALKTHLAGRVLPVRWKLVVKVTGSRSKRRR